MVVTKPLSRIRPGGRRALASILLLGLAALAGCGLPGRPAAPASPLLADIKAGRSVGPPIVGAGAVWVANQADGTVSRIDPGSNRVVATIGVGDPAGLVALGCGPSSVHAFMRDTILIRRCDEPSDLTSDGHRVWAADNAGHAIVRIDPATNRVAQRLAIGADPFDLAYGDGSLWATTLFYGAPAVLRIDPANGGRLATIGDLPIRGGSGIAVGAGAVWVACPYAGSVVRIDPASNRLTATIPVQAYPLAVSVGPGGVWVRNEDSGTVSRIDAASDRVVATVPAPPPASGPGVDALASGPDGLWVSGVTLERVDPATNRVNGRIDLEGSGASEGFGSIWMTSVFGTVQRIDPRAAVPLPADSG